MCVCSKVNTLTNLPPTLPKTTKGKPRVAAQQPLVPLTEGTQHFIALVM